ncbi:hypothetical protein glysoja_025743, partial [Glycine soja]
WMTCIKLTADSNFCISHIYCEGNICADRLISFGAQYLGYFWWDSPPFFVSQELLRYKQGL